MSTYKKLALWSTSRYTGASSKAIARRFLGIIPSDGFGYPVDCGDFGRCHRLLREVPAIRIEIMRGISPTWDRLAEHWAELTALYEKELPTGRWPEFNYLIGSLLSSQANQR